MSSDHPHIILRYLRRLGAGSLLISILIHLIVLGGAAVYVISSVRAPIRPSSPSGAGGVSMAPPADRHVPVPRQSPSLATLPSRLTVETSNSAVSLPDLPNLPGTSGVGPVVKGTLDGVGGPDTVGPIGKGPINPFGPRESQPGGSLVGRFYDFKQLAGPSPKPNPDLVRLGAGPLAEKELNTFTRGTWNPDALSRFYQAPMRLYATQIFIPNMEAGEGPAAYGVEKTVQGRAWVAHYRARVTPPETGTYRFVGGADDFLVVRMDGHVVLDGGLFAVSTFKTDRPNSPAYPYEFNAPGNNLQKSRRGGFVVGNAMNLRAGLFYDIDILIGEGLGGHFYAHLLVEKEGETYAKDGHGNPILPVFRLADSPVPGEKDNIPSAQKDGAVWRAMAPR